MDRSKLSQVREYVPKFDVGVCLFFGKLLGLVKATQGHRRGLFVVVDDILLDGMKVGTR